MELTSKFRQICTIVEKEYNIQSKETSLSKLSKDEVEFNKRFIQDSYKLMSLIRQFVNEIQEIRPRYLLVEEGPDDEKDKIDDESTIYVHRLNKLFLNLEHTNSQKLEIEKKRWRNDLYVSTMSVIRSLILQKISFTLKESTDSLSEMKQIRLNKKKQIKSLSYRPTESIQITDETLQIEDPVQLQMLETENHDLLIANKEEEIQKISKLQESVLDIINLQKKLMLTINEQNLQIESVISNSGYINIDLQRSNKEFRKLENLLSNNVNYLMYLLVISGIVILMIDYIKP